MNIKPWEVPGVPWRTESAFWMWVRGVLRKGWSKHPVKLEYIRQHRKRIKNPKPSTRFPEVWGMTCEICKKDHVQTNIEIDHKGDEGTFRGLQDAEGYMAHLFLVDFSTLRALCKECHQIVSYSQRQGISFEEARAAKQVLEITKQPVKKVLEFLMQHGYTGASVSNATKRKELVTSILQGAVHKGE